MIHVLYRQDDILNFGTVAFLEIFFFLRFSISFSGIAFLNVSYVHWDHSASCKVEEEH